MPSPRNMNASGWAVVTGAAGGLGSEFALQLAQRGYDIVALDLEGGRLCELSKRVEQASSAAFVSIECDLSRESERMRGYAAAVEGGREVSLLVNNVGTAFIAPFLDRSLEEQRLVVELNIRSTLDFSYLFARHMREHGQPSKIINLASLGALQPTCDNAVYCASKSFIYVLSNVLHAELADDRIQCSCVLPGITNTRFAAVSGMKIAQPDSAMIMSAEQVVRLSLREAFAGRRVIVPGALNKLSRFLFRLFPEAMALRLATSATRRMYARA